MPDSDVDSHAGRVNKIQNTDTLSNNIKTKWQQNRNLKIVSSQRLSGYCRTLLIFNKLKTITKNVFFG